LDGRSKPLFYKGISDILRVLKVGRKYLTLTH
jgi:hypothetical protein